MKVYLIGKSCLTSDIDLFLKEVAEGWKPEASSPSDLCEISGRICYMSFKNPRPGGKNSYIKNILEKKHGSVLEHAVFTLALIDIPRYITHELIRHRAGFSYSQTSQRYVKLEPNNFTIPKYVEDILNKDVEVNSKWEKLKEEIINIYLDIENRVEGSRKEKLEAARFVLPNCTSTNIIVTANARSWRHLLEMRCSPYADREFRILSEMIYWKLLKEDPVLFSDYEINRLEDGTVYLSSKHEKV